MPDLAIDCIDARADPWAVGPTLNFRLRISASDEQPIHAIALRSQIRIEPHKRRYDDAEAAKLNDVFGERARWSDTVKPMQFAQVSVMVPTFRSCVEVDVPVPCTYDMEIATTRYFHAMSGGDVPLILLFSGTMFLRGDQGFSVSPVPWHKEADYRLPVAEWRAMMDRFFPGSGWLRLSTQTLDELAAFKNARALPTWEQAVTELLSAVRDGVR